MVLFTNKDEVPPLFRALAANLGPSTGAVFGAVHEREKEALENFKVKKVRGWLACETVAYLKTCWQSKQSSKVQEGASEEDSQGRPMVTQVTAMIMT